MKMMTILYILDYGTVGGATKAFIDMCHEMKILGINPIVVTGKRNELNELLENEGFRTIAAGHFTAIENFSFKGWKWPLRLIKYILRYYICEYKALRKLQQEVDFSNIDIIHTNSARNTLGCRLSKKYKVPHIVHIREFGDKDFDCIQLIPNYISLLNQYTNIFLSVSGAVREYWNSKGIDSKKNCLMYDGVSNQDITVSSDEAKKSKILKMFMAGGVYPTKGQHLAVEAIGFLPIEIRNNITLDIAGWYSPKYVAAMRQYAKERGYGDKIKFLGSINNVHQRIGSYQIGLMCSKSEGFGLVTVEYMHGQLGVIASNSGACPELVEDGKTGMLFESGISADLAKCIMRMYNNRNMLIMLSRNARIEARKRFTAEINAKNIYAIYKNIIKSNKS